MGRQRNLVTKTHSTLHDLAVDHNTTVLLLVEYWDSEWTIWISLLNWQIVNNLNEGWTIVPRAYLLVKRFQQVGASKSGNWDPRDVSFLVPSFQQEGHQTSSDLIPTLLFPVAAVIVHLVNHNNQFLDSQTFSKLHMFTSLAIFFKTSLIFTLPCGNNESSVICASCSHDHIRNIVLVTWGIEQSELLRFGLKIGTTNFNSLTFGLLFIRRVHDIGEPP